MARKGKQFKYEKPYFHHQKHAPKFSFGYCETNFKDVQDAKNLSKKPKKKK